MARGSRPPSTTAAGDLVSRVLAELRGMAWMTLLCLVFWLSVLVTVALVSWLRGY